MSDWKTLELLTPEQETKALKLFIESELPYRNEYEFCEVGGGKMKKRMRPDLVKGAPKKAAADLPSPAPTLPLADRIHRFAPGDLLDSPTQPRSHYAEQALNELAANVRGRGVLEPLLARLVDGKPELIKGHRRKRAALAAGLADVPVILVDYTTPQVIEIQLLEIAQSVAVDPIDEARAMERMLNFTSDEGELRYPTRAALAERISKSVMHVENRLRLLRCPREFQEAMQKGIVGPDLGKIVAAVPDEKSRQKFAREVLKGYGEGPMSGREAIDHRRANYTVELRNPPFDPKDAKLVPVNEKNGERALGGACTDCPFNTAVAAPGEQKIHMCLMPPCYYVKQAAHLEEVKVQTLDAGGLVIEGQAAEKYVFPDGTPKADSGMVNLDQVPTAGDVVGERKAPKWRVMLEAKTEPVTIANKHDGSETTHDTAVRVKPTVVIDAKGRAHHLVERSLAIEAAKRNGYAEMFTAKSRRQSAPRNAADSASRDAEKKRKAADDVKKKLLAAIALATVEEVVVAVGKSGITEDGWLALFELAIFHAALDAKDFVCQRRSLTVKDGQHEKAIRAHAETLTAERMPGLVVELLLAAWVKASGAGSPGLRAFVDAYEIDVAAIRERVKADLAQPKVRAKKPKPEPPPKPVRELIAELSKKHGIKSLAKLDALSMKTIGRPYEVLKGSELNQLVDAIKALPVPASKPAKKKGGAK